MVGIGTTKPASTLDVKGGGTIHELFSLHTTNAIQPRHGSTSDTWLRYHGNRRHRLAHLDCAKVRLPIGVRQCQRMFRQLGFRLRKPRPALAQANPAVQKAHKKNSKT
jgi:hypothetical protein